MPINEVNSAARVPQTKIASAALPPKRSQPQPVAQNTPESDADNRQKVQDIFSAASQKTSRSWPAEMPSTSLKRKRSEGEEASLSTKRQKAAAKTPEISQDFKKTISTKQAFAQVQSEGLNTFVNAWKKSLPKGLPLTDLTHIKKSTSAGPAIDIDGVKVRSAATFERSNDPFVQHGKTKSHLVLPSLTRATQLINAEFYAQKYGAEILFVNEDKEAVDLNNVATSVIQGLSEGQSVGLVAPIGQTAEAQDHSIPILFQRNGDYVEAHILDTAFHLWYEAPGDYQYFPDALIDKMNDIGQTTVKQFHDETPRQSDHAGCHADALAVLKDALRENPGERELSVNGDKTQVRPAMLKTTQLPSFLKSQNFNPEEKYQVSKDRALKEHRESHSMKTKVTTTYTFDRKNLTADEKSDVIQKFHKPEKGETLDVERNKFHITKNRQTNMFLRLKSLQYVDRAVKFAEHHGATTAQQKIAEISAKRTVG